MFRLAHLIPIVALVLSPVVASGDPSPANSTVPPLLKVLSVQPYGVGPGDAYNVTVRDELGNPLPGVPVYLDFAPCSHVMFAAEQILALNLAVDCVAETLRAETDATGAATFVVYGSVMQRNPPVADQGCVAVYAGSPQVLLGHTSPASFDADGVNGLTANDLSLILCDFFTASPAFARSDFNGDGSVSLSDISLWLAKYFSARGNARTADHCGGVPATTPQLTVPGSPLRLAWTDCAGAGGTVGRTFACNINSGSDKLVASFIAPANVQSLSGFDAQLWIVGPEGSAIGNWWRFDPGACRSGAQSVATGATTCLPIESPSGSWTVSQQAEYPGLLGEFSNVVVVRITGAISGAASPLEAGQEYELFTLTIPHTKATGAGSCAGCAGPVVLRLDRLWLRQTGVATVGCSLPIPGAPLPDFFLREGGTATAYWQEMTGPVPVGVPPAPTAQAAFGLAVTNPAMGGARVTITLPHPSRCTLALYDIAGRRQRVLLAESVPAGTRALDWDGRDDAGRALPSGYYLVKLQAEAGTLTRALIHLR